MRQIGTVRSSNETYPLYGEVENGKVIFCFFIKDGEERFFGIDRILDQYLNDTFGEYVAELNSDFVTAVEVRGPIIDYVVREARHD